MFRILGSGPRTTRFPCRTYADVASMQALEIITRDVQEVSSIFKDSLSPRAIWVRPRSLSVGDQCTEKKNTRDPKVNPQQGGVLVAMLVNVQREHTVRSPGSLLLQRWRGEQEMFADVRFRYSNKPSRKFPFMAVKLGSCDEGRIPFHVSGSQLV